MADQLTAQDLADFKAGMEDVADSLFRFPCTLRQYARPSEAASDANYGEPVDRDAPTEKSLLCLQKEDASEEAVVLFGPDSKADTILTFSLASLAGEGVTIEAEDRFVLPESREPTTEWAITDMKKTGGFRLDFNFLKVGVTVYRAGA